jgi:hypothetical protein
MKGLYTNWIAAKGLQIASRTVAMQITTDFLSPEAECYSESAHLGVSNFSPQYLHPFRL